jgi:CheY-like chemotaxis protein
MVQNLLSHYLRTCMSKTILLVEDEDSMQILLTYVLNGKDAISLLRTSEFDLLCSDIMLPEVNGIEVCAYARKKYPDLPIIVISSKSQEKEIETALEVGANDYITKPFDVDYLLQIIKKYL